MCNGSRKRRPALPGTSALRPLIACELSRIVPTVGMWSVRPEVKKARQTQCSATQTTAPSATASGIDPDYKEGRAPRVVHEDQAENHLRGHALIRGVRLFILAEHLVVRRLGVGKLAVLHRLVCGSREIGVRIVETCCQRRLASSRTPAARTPQSLMRASSPANTYRSGGRQCTRTGRRIRQTQPRRATCRVR